MNNVLFLEMFKLTASFSLILFITTGFAQTGNFTFTNYTSVNGLADNYVSSLLQDSRGFMWFGTREGLSRFDGTNFKNFFAKKNDSTALSGNTIAYLYEYIPGHLLMTSNGQATSMNTVTQQFHQPKQFKNKLVFSISRLKNNLLSINCPDTCFIINNRLQITDTLIPPLKNKGNPSHTVFINDTTWLVGSAYEYFRYNPDDKKYDPLLEQKDMPATDRMLKFQYYDEKNGWLYFSNYWTGLFRYLLKGKILHKWKLGVGPSDLNNGNTSFVMQKNDSTLWIGNSEGSGILSLNTHTNLITPFVESINNPSSLTGNAVFFNYTDRENNEWIGTTNGIIKLNNAASNIKNWKTEFRELNNNSVLLNMAKGNDGQIYLSVFGTPYGYKINSADDKVSSLNKSKLPNAWCMNSFGNEIIFTGGGASVTKFNPLTNQYSQSGLLKKYYSVSDVVILAFKHSNGDEWYSGNNGGGFVRVSAKDGSIHNYKKDGPRGKFTVSYYANYTEDKNGDLWFGVNKSGRLLHWDKETDWFNEVSFDTVKGITGKNHSGITDMTLGNDNNIWMTFDGTGLIKYDPEKNTGIQYSMQDGLPTNYTSFLKFDNKNRLWIGTLKGLSCLLVDENRFINFTREDGLPAEYFDERCSYYDSSRHQFWMGSKNTLMRFNPDVLLKNKKKQLPIYIDEIIVNGKNYREADFDNIHFLSSQNNLLFRFIALDLNSGKDIEYSFRLSGADKDWIYNSNITTASYANLPSGSYTFTVKAKLKGDNEWELMQQPLNFTIATPWNKTWWFRLLIIAAAAFLVWFIIRAYYLRKIEKEKAILGKKQAIEKERTRIATDMHDDFGASLSRIKFLSEKLQLRKPDSASEKTDLGKISIYSDEMSEKLNEIVWALNQRYDSLGDLVSFCRSYASEYLLDKDIKLNFNAGEMNENKIQGEVRRNIFLVIKESLQNIVKHAAATEVSVSFNHDKQANEISVVIADNGKGIDKETIRPFANGLENMKKRMADINGSFSIENKEARPDGRGGKGTQISISAPT